MPDPNGGGGGGGGGDFVSTIPEAYRDKEWVKQNAGTADGFFKFVDNLNTSFGKKGPAVPGENASSEEVKAFNKWVGVPDKEDDYQFTSAEELKDFKRDPEMEKAVKKIMLESGVPKSVAAKLQSGYEKLLFTKHQQILAENKKLDEEFDKSTKELFGDKKDVVLANAKKFLKEHVPATVQAKLDGLDNNSLVVLTAALNGIVNKYVKEDAFKGGDAGGGGGAETMETLSAEQRKLFASEEFRNSRHADHQKAHDRNKIIMDKMRSLSKK